MFVDTHAHLYSDRFALDRLEVLDRAKSAGIEAIFLPNIDSGSIVSMHQLELESSGYCKAMMGLHPCSVKENFQQELEVVHHWLSQRRYCAVGEIGTDLYWDKTTFDWQAEAFITQVKWAFDFSLPIVIHCRESIKETIGLLQANSQWITGGIFHCFSGGILEAQTVIRMGFHLGIGGPLTYKKSALQAVVESVPLEYLVLETDAPYLPPVPHRGSRNESAYIPIVAQAIAEIKGCTIEEVATVTTQTSYRIFGIK